MVVESALKPLERYSLGSSAYASLKRAIITKELPPGSRVTEKMLQQSLGVSRSPVREAIARLAQEGYLIGSPYKGYYVNHPTPREVRDVHEVFVGLTELALVLAMQRANDEQIAELLALTDAMERALEEGQIEAYSEAVSEFRRWAVVFTRNEALVDFCDQLVNHPAHIRPWAIDDLSAVKGRAPDLPRLRKAILARDGTTVAQVFGDKMRRALKAVLAELGE